MKKHYILTESNITWKWQTRWNTYFTREYWWFTNKRWNN